METCEKKCQPSSMKNQKISFFFLNAQSFAATKFYFYLYFLIAQSFVILKRVLISLSACVLGALQCVLIMPFSVPLWYPSLTFSQVLVFTYFPITTLGHCLFSPSPLTFKQYLLSLSIYHLSLSYHHSVDCPYPFNKTSINALLYLSNQSYFFFQSWTYTELHHRPLSYSTSLAIMEPSETTIDPSYSVIDLISKTKKCNCADFQIELSPPSHV